MHQVEKPKGAARVVQSGLTALFAAAALLPPAAALAAPQCLRTLTADVVVLDQPLMFNRLGSQNVNGMMFALRRDVVSKATGAPCGGSCSAGAVTLRPDKRPRPLVLRVAAGDCLDVAFQNLLTPSANPANAPHQFLLVDDQVSDRRASFHAQGLELRSSMQDDGSFVGQATASGLVGSGGRATYKYYAAREGTFLVTSHGAVFGSDGAAGNNTNGLFAVVNVEPPGANFYRSQVTEEEMRLAIDAASPASCPASAAGVTPVRAATPGFTCAGQPILNYEATYPAGPGSAVPTSTTSGATAAGAAFIPLAQDPTTLAVAFPSSGFVKLLPPPGSTTAPEVVAYTIDPATAGFTLATRVPSTTTSAVVDAASTSIALAQDPATLSPSFPASGNVTLVALAGSGATNETFAYTIDPAAPSVLVLAAGVAPAQTWDIGTQVQLTSATGAPISLSTLTRAWPAGATVQSVDASGAVATVAIPSVWAREGKAGLPVLNMLAGSSIVHSDLNAIITGPAASGAFPASTYPLESKGFTNPTLPNRLEPFREYTVVFHDEAAVANAFPLWFARNVNGAPNPLAHTLHAVGDVFQINYGSGAIGPEVIANRLGVGPMHDCLDCAYEEFFLTSPAVGDPAMVVDVPAVTGLEACPPPGFTAPAGACAAVGPKATRAYYPDDPSNVHHSYIGDHVRFRNVHTGKEHHIFHLHNHQWLFNPNDDNSNYLDAQGIGPGAGYTYEINFGGSGNRNKSAGDAIFHCHFYPHFAQGMWELWRNHDVFEAGTPLAASAGAFHGTPFALQDGTPAVETVAGPGGTTLAARARSLPDGEIAGGTPIPAIVPLPGKAMAPSPGAVVVLPKIAPDNATVLGSVARVERKPETDAGILGAVAAAPAAFGAGFQPVRNPGFPFWLAGIENTVGQRMPSPPLDMAVSAGGWDGGLPRHALEGYAASGCAPLPGQTLAQARAACTHSVESRLDMTKELKKAKPVWFPEEGTDVEKSAMAFHAVRGHPSYALRLDGSVVQADFVTNGSGRPVPGAPFHEPCIDDTGRLMNGNGSFFDGRGGTGTTGGSPFTASSPRVYKGANIQFDAVLNKLGFHYPQERIGVLWEDAVPTITKKKPPEPFLMRMNTFDCVMYQHTNLVPAVYELDDYQIRTTTDIIGQHIHLPKWDLTTTDGSANGWNYEDGTLSPDSVRERIAAINAYNPSGAGNPVNSKGLGQNAPLVPLDHPYFGAVQPGSIWSPDGKPAWQGARTTLERWFADPVVNVAGVHRGLGIIFTHDHFGPSTHQQIGLYATVLVEPPNSKWVHNETGRQLGDRAAVGDGGRKDGGPTSWQAAILTGDLDGDKKDDSFREFYFEYTDFQHAYKPGVYIGRGQDGGSAPPPNADSFRLAVNASTKEQATGKLGKQGAFPDTLVISQTCFGGVARPCPEAISADDPGFMVVNYRNEPIGYRVYDPNATGPDGKKGAQTAGKAGDLAFALDSRTDRAISYLNVQPTGSTSINGTRFPPPINASSALAPGDPFTPMMRAYFGDRIRMKVQAGGDEESHTVTVSGMKWLQGGSGFGFAPNSGWRNAQHAGISEQFSFAAPALPLTAAGQSQADYMYAINASMDGFWNGTWGILRTYGSARTDLPVLPGTTGSLSIANLSKFQGSCPAVAPVRAYDLTAVLANDVLDNQVGAVIVPADATLSQQHAGGPLAALGGTLVYNPRSTTIAGLSKPADVGGGGFTQDPHLGGVLHDPTAILYVRTADLVARSATDARCLVKGKLDPTQYTCPVKLRPRAPIEPVVLRAAAGDCVKVVLRNKLPAAMPDLPGFKHLPPSITRDGGPVPSTVVAGGDLSTFNNNLVRPSSYVGLRPAMVAHNVRADAGQVIGQNQQGTLAAPGASATYRWYAGDISLSPATGSSYNLVGTPVEFGGTNLFPADMIKQGQKGLGGALVILPQGSTWTETDYVVDNQVNGAAADCSIAGASTNPRCRETRTSATVNGAFRDFAAVIQKGMVHRYGDGEPVEQIAAEKSVAEDAEDSGEMALNYRTDPLWFRFGLPPNTPFTGPASFRTVPNAGDAYSNTLTGGADPAAQVWSAKAGSEVRIHLLEPTGSNRAGVMTLHGHVWQRAPYVCPSSYLGLTGNCNPTGFLPTGTGTAISSTGVGPLEVASRSIGDNLLSTYMSAQDQIQPASHFTMHLPSAGGSYGVSGDYLLMDRSGFGTLAGVWGILRVTK